MASAAASLGLVAVAENRIGAHEPQPAFDIGAVVVQPAGETRDHAADHVAARLVTHVSRGRHIVARLGSGRGNLLAARTRERLAHEFDPRCAGRGVSKERAPDRPRLHDVAVLLGRETEKISSLRFARIVCNGAFERSLGIDGDDAIGGGGQRLAKIGLPRGGIAVERQRFSSRRDGIVEAAEPHIDRRDDFPAGAVIGIAGKVGLDFADQAGDRFAALEVLTRAKAGSHGTFGEPSAM